ncbi:MAG: cache domain-containing protein, partial [Spirochaetales bacterium]|nr:cache domain-containing protein [Spirochaetales bacterium]
MEEKKKNLRFKKLKYKMILYFMLAGLLPLTVINLQWGIMAKKELVDKAFISLQSIQSIKCGQVRDYFNSGLNDLEYLSKKASVLDFYKIAKERYLDKLPPYNSDFKEYNSFVENEAGSLSADIGEFLSANDYNNFYLIDFETSYVLFTQYYSRALGTNLADGRFNRSLLADCWEEARSKKDSFFMDFDSFALDKGSYFGFIGAPIYDEDGALAAIAVLQLSPDFITKIMSSKLGVGETGEWYLVNWDAADKAFSYRSKLPSRGFQLGYQPKGSKPKYWK